MSQPSKSPSSIQDDDRLAIFTDQVLEGKLRQVEADEEEELFGLEETILRLKHSFPAPSLNQAVVKQMQVRLHARIRREGLEAKQPFWKKWFEPQFRSQFGVAFAAVALLIGIAVFPPLFANIGTSITATALNSTINIAVVSILIGVILVFIWIKRPK